MQRTAVHLPGNCRIAAGNSIVQAAERNHNPDGVDNNKIEPKVEELGS